MGKHQLPGEPSVALVLRRSARARRISLRVSKLDGRVTLTLPRGIAEAEALEFAQSRADWIRRHLADRPEDVVVQVGSVLPLEGREVRISAAADRRIRLTENELSAPVQETGARLAGWLKARARSRLAVVADSFAADLGRPYARLTLRDTRSRWGSCSSSGGLMFSWRLILAPPEVLRYVAAHEVAHLAEMNHSPAFWALVERLYGPYRVQRDWLRTEGNALHRYRF